MSGSDPTPLGDLSVGWRRLSASVRIVAGAWLASVLLALPLGAVMGEILSGAIGSSEAGERLYNGFDHLWFRGFRASHEGLAATFDPSITGFGAVARSLDTFVRGALLDVHPAVFAVGLVYALLWVFIHGGLLSRFVRPGSQQGFFGAARWHFPRLLSLSMGGLVVVALILHFGLGALSEVVDVMTYNVVDERLHFGLVVAKYLAVWLAIWPVAVVVDYAKMFAVLQPEASLLGCVYRAWRFTSRRWRHVYGLSALLIGVLIAFVAAYAVFAPGPGQSNGFQLLLAFALGQSYVVGRIALRVWWVGAQTAVLVHPSQPASDGVSTVGAALR